MTRPPREARETGMPPGRLAGPPLWVPRERTLRRLLSTREAAREAGARIALVLPDGRALTWRRLAAAVAPRAAALARRDRQRPLALVVHADLESVAWLLAALEAGVPVLPLHPARPEASRREMVRRAHALEPPPLEPDRESRPLPGQRTGDARQPAAIVATSGTTGRPRLAVLPARALVAAALASRRRLGPAALSRGAMGLSAAHVGGLMVLVRALVLRRSVLLPPEGSFDPVRWLRHLERGRASGISLVPSMLARWLQAGLRPPASLRLVLVGGAACPEALWREAVRRGWPLRLTWGMTESCGQLATWRPTDPPGHHAGPPLSGVEVRLTGSGELQVRAPTLLSGWWPSGSPLDPGGWLPTDDAGRLEGGRVRVLGRLDERIQSGGENVDPLEVEEALRRLPGVRDACVFATPSERWGEAVSAALVLEPSAPWADQLEALRQALRCWLPGYALPRRIALLPELPLGPTGKPDRAAARAASAGRWALDLEPPSTPPNPT